MIGFTSSFARAASALFAGFLTLSTATVEASPVPFRLSLAARNAAQDVAHGNGSALNKRVSPQDLAAYSMGIPDAGGSWYESARVAQAQAQATGISGSAPAIVTPLVANNDALAPVLNAATTVSAAAAAAVPSQAMIAGSPADNAAAYSMGIPNPGEWYAQELAKEQAATTVVAAAPAATEATATFGNLRNGVMQQGTANELFAAPVLAADAPSF